VGLTLGLLTSLLLTAAPVSANVTQATVDLDDAEISADPAEYTVTFRINVEIDAADAAKDDIIIEFPEGTDLTNVDGVPANVTIAATSGIGSTAFSGVNPTTAVVTDDLTLTIETPAGAVMNATNTIGVGAIVQIKIGAVINPDDIGTFSLLVSTEVEDTEVESEDYDIEAPTVLTPAGVVQLWNPSDILIDNYTGDSAIDDAYADAGDDYVIKVGAGRYVSDIDVDTDVADVTIESSHGADDTVIVGDIYIDDDGVTLDGFTIHGTSSYGVEINSNEVTVQNCVFLEEGEDQAADHIGIWGTDDVVQDCSFTVEDGWYGIDAYAVEITDCDFTVEDGAIGIYFDDDGVEVTDCTFTGSSGLGIYAYYDGTIEGCTFDGLEDAIEVDDPGTAVTIEGNTFKNGADGAAILVTDAEEVIITNNTFTANADYILEVVEPAEVVYMNFNIILADNEGDDDGYVLFNADTEIANCQANWWGDAAGPDEDIFNDVDLFAYTPVLLGIPAGDALSAANLAVSATFDAEDECGVTITLSDTTAAGDDLLDVVGACSYATNPVGALGDAVGFWDAFAIDDDDDATKITVKIYTPVTEDTEAYVWADAKAEWIECSAATPNLFGGWMTIVIDTTSTPAIDDLEGLPFAVVEPPAEEDLDAPVIVAPESGTTGASLTPTFAWDAVDDADGYFFQLADNANFVAPLVKLDGDYGRLIVTAYAYVTKLPYSTAYYWRVKAVSGTEDAGNLVESDWVSAVFVTMNEPEEPVPPVVIEPSEPPIIEVQIPPTPIIEPIVEVITPPATPITPAWIYAIIGVGAVLVIALIVLVVRTRRVA